MDCSIQPLKRKKGLYQISTTDFFFPLVNDPYVMGKIACANVLSDLYALGVEYCDNMLMLLSSSRKLSDLENDVCMKHIMKGFRDLALEAETQVTGGQTVKNEDLLLGGVGMSVCSEEEFIRPTQGKAGDVLVLTKPIGTQVAVNFHQWMELEKYAQKWNQCMEYTITESDEKNTHPLNENVAKRAYAVSMESMSRLNRNAAKLMHKYKAHGATDVTGFGLLGHAQNMVLNQEEMLDFEIHTLPIIDGMMHVNDAVNGMFRLMQGYSAETSGGLLVMLPDEEAAKAYVKEIAELDGQPAWIIGRAIQGNRKARIVDDVKVLHV